MFHLEKIMNNYAIKQAENCIYTVYLWKITLIYFQK